MGLSTSLVQLLVELLLIVTGVHASSCPIELEPQRVVVKHGDPVSIRCSTKEAVKDGIGWESTEAGTGVTQVNVLTWRVDSLKNWKFTTKCYFTPLPNSSFQQCDKAPEVVIYTFPERISITSNKGVVTEMEEHIFTCDIHDVAPVQNLTINWYKGDKLDSFVVFNTLEKEPVNRSSVYRYTPPSSYTKDKIRCEAHLDLSPEGPQLSVSSEEYTITVHYPPSQIEELEDSEVDVGAAVTLTCSSVGFPQPEYSWTYYQAPNVTEETVNGKSILHILKADVHNMGLYTCNATNLKGCVSKTVKVTVRGAKRECPIEISQNRMVLEYGAKSENVTCQPTSASERNLEKHIYWEDRGDMTIHLGTVWSPDTHNNWDSRPVCVAHFSGIGQCEKQLSFTLYKTPASVSIHTVNVTDLADEDEEIQLQCDVTDVAPAQNLVVLWYRGAETFASHTKDALKVTGCLPTTDSDCRIGGTRSQQNVSSTVKLRRTHKDTEFRCRAHLDLGSEGPTPPPEFSEVLTIALNRKPVIKTTDLPDKMTVYRGYSRELICDADGHPPPKIQWLWSSNKEAHVTGNKLAVSEEGFYNCSATNEVGSAYRVVEVILKEDYLPLVAGLVAATLVTASFVFVFIYSIYYKCTRIFRYNLKNPMFNMQKGNVAHNGWETQFPVTKMT